MINKYILFNNSEVYSSNKPANSIALKNLNLPIFPHDVSNNSRRELWKVHREIRLI